MTREMERKGEVAIIVGYIARKNRNFIDNSWRI